MKIEIAFQIATELDRQQEVTDEINLSPLKTISNIKINLYEHDA